MKLNIQLFAEGKVVIETELDTKGLDKGIKQIEKKGAKIEIEPQVDKHFYDVLEELSDDEKARLKIGVEVDEKNFDKVKDDYKNKIQNLSKEELLKLHAELDIDDKKIGEQYQKIQEQMSDVASKYSKDVGTGMGVGDWTVYTGSDNWTKEGVVEYQELINKENEYYNKLQDVWAKNIAIREILEQQQKEAQALNAEKAREIPKDLQILGSIRELVEQYNLIQKQEIVSDEDIQEVDELKLEIQELIQEYEKISGKTLHIKGITDVNNELREVNNNITSIGSGITGLIKKIGRWALAIFGIRSAYMFIRQEMGVLSQYNEKIGADIEYMRWAIANALKPIIEKIIQLSYRLLVYIGYIIKQLFGINIFANASAKAFERQKKALGGSNKEAKELQKTLAGFDEMNIIQSSGDATRGGGGGGISLPTQDLKDMLENIEIPEWLIKLTNWLKKLKDYIVENWDWLWKLGVALTAVFGAAKIAGLINNITGLTGALGLGTGLLGILQSLVAIGAIVITISIVQKIKKEADELGKQIDEINQKGYKGWTEYVDKVKSGEEDVGILIQNNNMHRNKGLGQLKDSQNTLNKILGLSDNQLGTAINVAKESQYAANAEFELYKNKKLTKKQQEDIYNDLVGQKRYLEEMIPILKKEGIETDIYEGFLQDINHDLNIMSPMWGRIVQFTSDADAGIVELCDNSGNVVTAWTVATDKIKQALDNVKNFNKEKINDKEVNIIFNGEFSRLASNIANSVQSALNNVSVKKLASNLVNLLSKIPGFNTSGIKKAFGLAKGGIVNMPGRGIPYGGATIGEQRPEGIVPLTDTQQMALLGEAIGRFVRIDNVIDVNMDSRKIKRIMATSDNRDRMVGNG